MSNAIIREYLKQNGEGEETQYLMLIKDILETNQRSIDYIKTTDIWFDTVGDKIVWGDELPKLAS